MKLSVCFVVFMMCGLGISTNAFAQNQSPTVPNGLCSNPTQKCTARQLDILKQFDSATQAPALPVQHSLYQGSCFMISSTYGAEQEHFGFIYVRSQPDGTWDHNGQFGFFYPQNPYKQMTAEQAAAKFPTASKYKVDARSTDWLVEIDTKNNWRYFARQTDEGKLILIGQWGIYDAILCEMEENK